MIEYQNVPWHFNFPSQIGPWRRHVRSNLFVLEYAAGIARNFLITYIIWKQHSSKRIINSRYLTRGDLPVADVCSNHIWRILYWTNLPLSFDISIRRFISTMFNNARLRQQRCYKFKDHLERNYDRKSPTSMPPWLQTHRFDFESACFGRNQIFVDASSDKSWSNLSFTIIPPNEL